MGGRHDSPRWAQADTPRLLIDRVRLDRNIETFHQSVLSSQVALRSHVKTHKIPEIATLQLRAGACGIAAAKISEAIPFVDSGVEDVVIAYPVFGAPKWQAAAELARRCHLVVHVENADAVIGLAAAAATAGVEIDVRVEVDTGFHRTGGNPAETLELCRLIEGTPMVRLDGITTHRSIFFPDAGDRDPVRLGTDEGLLMVAVAEMIRASSIEVRNVVGGSTPTAAAMAAVDGVTEVCAGTYVFGDAGMADLGVIAEADIALSVLATTVSTQREGRYTVDAGAKTLSKDQYPGNTVGHFGRLMESRDILVGLTDEHGIVQAADEAPKPGTKVRILPAHVCPAVNLADEVTVIDGDKIVDQWQVAARGAVR